MSRFFRLGLIGWPLGHSLSPRLHAAALAACGLAGEYRLYPIPPAPGGLPALQALLQQLQQGELDGLNVTIPHKQHMLPLLDAAQGVLTPAAREIGAVNTLSLENGQLVGDNTDAAGFINDLPELPAGPGKAALVLGAGGSARAVTYALANAGWQVYLAARRPEQAQALAAAFAHLGPAPQALAGLPAREEDLPAYFWEDSPLPGASRLLVNTTPLGMHPHTAGSPWAANLRFPPGMVVYDLVYNPPETTLLRQAHQAGLQTANGLGMLIGQAALAFQRWTEAHSDSLPAIRQAMRAAAGT